MELTLEKICQKCGKPNCEVLYWDRDRKDWKCPSCTNYLKNEELSLKRNKTSLRGK